MKEAGFSEALATFNQTTLRNFTVDSDLNSEILGHLISNVKQRTLKYLYMYIRV